MEETVAWLVQLAAMFEDIPAQSRYLSGPLGVFTLTNDYPWQETYTELSMFAQKAVMEAHVTAAKAHNYYLMRRVSAKLSVNGPMKYHFFHPATIADATWNLRELTRPQRWFARSLSRGIISGSACTGMLKAVSSVLGINTPHIIRWSISTELLVMLVARECSLLTQDTRC